jgi:hypothetical protein
MTNCTMKMQKTTPMGTRRAGASTKLLTRARTRTGTRRLINHPIRAIGRTIIAMIGNVETQ